MDNLTHTLFGAVLAQAGLERWTRRATPALMIGANLPDIDVLFVRVGPPFAYLAHHRGVSHAVVGMIGLAVLLAAILWGIDHGRGNHRLSDGPPRSFFRLFVLSLIGTVSHTFLDFTNSYGVRPWLPFNDRWMYGDLVFIMDPWLWLILGGPLVCLTLRRRWHAVGYAVIAGALSWLIVIAAADRVPGPVPWLWGLGLLAIITARWLQAGRYGSRLAVGALAVVVVYWTGLGVANRVARAKAIRYVQAHLRDYPGHTLSVMPQPADPFRWTLVVETDSTLYTGRVDLLGQREIAHPLEPVPRAFGSQVVQAALQTESGRVMLRFARHLFAEVKQTEHGSVVILRDLRFGRSNTDGFAVVRIPINGRLQSSRPDTFTRFISMMTRVCRVA